jgi:ABC-type phosphate/phosphonate transport system substrate-binding protein
VPTHVIAIRSTITEADQKALRQALESLNEKGNEGLRDKVFTSKLVEVDADAHMRSIREALEFLGNAE